MRAAVRDIYDDEAVGLKHSRGRIDRAGQALRTWRSDATSPTSDDLVVALRVVEEFRAAHATPLTRVAANLRYYVAEVSDGRFIVGQRLKRMDTIRDKLGRQPRMALSRMHDIAGCRAVVPSQDAADALLARLRSQRRWDILDRTWDYVAAPKTDGYRSKHVVVRKDGVLIEVQIRTSVQHAWAELVERLDRTYGLELKAGRASPEVTAAVARAADLFAAHEAGELDIDAIMTQVSELLAPILRPTP